MSLRVWLPLTKDLRQQGLSNVTVTNNGATYNATNGKLGGCYVFTKSADTIILNGTAINSLFTGGSQPFSIAMWVCHDDATRAVLFGDFSLSGAINFNVELYSGHGIRFYWAGSPDVSLTVNVGINTWTHVIITYDGSKVCGYQNGELKGTYNGTLATKNKTSGNWQLGRDNRTSDTPLVGKLNDFRLYDHCLSPMEAKELAKGLVLHYPLNRQGWGQDNLLPGSYRADGNTTNRIYGWQANGNGTPEIIKVDNIDCIHLQANCTGKYIPSIVSASKVFLEYGVEYTISCDLKFDKDITVTNSTPIHYHSGSSSSTDEFNTANINNGHGFNFKSISPAAGTTIPANTWQHYEQHIIAKTAPTDSSLPYLTYRAFIYGSVRTISETVSVNMWLKNWKIEKGSIATPWCPNSSDELANTMGLNSTTEYDCSGFCNNGMRTGTFTWTSDTPKYCVSQVFEGSKLIEADALPIETYTLSAWINWAELPSGYSIPIFDTNTGIAIGISANARLITYIGSSAGGAGSQVNISFTTNTWYHIIVVKTGATTRNTYINGELKSSSAANYWAGDLERFLIGGRHAANIYKDYFKGKICDVRAYATALSADDVKSLYQNSAYIDSSGNVYGAVHTEV